MLRSGSKEYHLNESCWHLAVTEYMNIVLGLTIALACFSVVALRLSKTIWTNPVLTWSLKSTSVFLGELTVYVL